MSSNLIMIENELEWHKYRGTGIGASEGASILGYNPYCSALEKFYEKVGFSPKSFYSVRALYGQITEQLTSELFMAWDNKPENHAKNIKNGIFGRWCIKYPKFSYIVNDDYPHIFSSPDREFTWGDKIGVLEIKDSSSMVVNSYINRIVPSHQIQTKIQMMVSDISFGILAYNLNAGGEYKEHEFFRDKIIWHNDFTGETITEQDYADKVKEFWHKVVKARTAMEYKRQAALDFQFDVVAECENIISSCEPPPDSSIAYENYVKENFLQIQRPLIQIQGTDEHEKVAEEFLKAKEDRKLSESKLQLAKNKVFNLCKQGQEIKLPGKGIISVNYTKAGVKIKVIL